MADFRNLYTHGMARLAAASPRVHLADPAANASEIIELMRRADAEHAALLVCPELCLSGYSLDDLHMQSALLASVREAIAKIAAASATLSPLVLAGAPIEVNGAVHGCAVAIHRGKVLGIVPKTYLPNYREYYEKRQFASAADAMVDAVTLNGETIPFGADLLFEARDLPGFILGVEICEDIWAPIPPSTFAALAGATVIANLSASNITIGKAAERDMLCLAHSQRATCAYVYAAAGYGESTTDTAWDGQLAHYELGRTIAESGRFADQSTILFADIDLERVVQERIRTGTFRDAARLHGPTVRNRRRIGFDLKPALDEAIPLQRTIDRFPYVPDDETRLDRDCFEAYNIQVQGLRRRLESSHVKKAVIGVSGGLDSTQALLVACRAFDLMKRPRTDIIGVTMPGFATSSDTKASAHALMKELGVDARELDIKPMANQMLADLKHPFAKDEKVYDVTFENVQAGLRTDYLFRLANKEGGLVVGTGDLSELALGWCTYGVGDHMSHYNVNASVAKTLIQHLIRWSAASGNYSQAAAKVMKDILASEISPELVPPGADGKVQSTEGAIGPYNLHDFFLYYTLRHGLAPAKIAFLADAAWSDEMRSEWPAQVAARDRKAYTLPEIVHWLEVFAQRFFGTTQFKRSVAPNGPKVTSGGSLSPRGDWRAPSDGLPAPWLADIEQLKKTLGL